MDALRRQAGKLRDQVAKQHQAVIKQLSSASYESSDVMVIDEVEMHRHQQLEKLYRSTRAGRMGNVRIHIPVHRLNGTTTSASMPSASTPMPSSQSQTIVVDNPMSVDKSGKLVQFLSDFFSLLI